MQNCKVWRGSQEGEEGRFGGRRGGCPSLSHSIVFISFVLLFSLLFFYFLKSSYWYNLFSMLAQGNRKQQRDREKERCSFCEISENNPHGLSTSLQKKTKPKFTPITRELQTSKYLNKKSFNLADFFSLINQSNALN